MSKKIISTLLALGVLLCAGCSKPEEKPVETTVTSVVTTTTTEVTTQTVVESEPTIIDKMKAIRKGNYNSVGIQTLVDLGEGIQYQANYKASPLTEGSLSAFSAVTVMSDDTVAPMPDMLIFESGGTTFVSGGTCVGSAAVIKALETEGVNPVLTALDVHNASLPTVAQMNVFYLPPNNATYDVLAMPNKFLINYENILNIIHNDNDKLIDTLAMMEQGDKIEVNDYNCQYLFSTLSSFTADECSKLMPIGYNGDFTEFTELLNLIENTNFSMTITAEKDNMFKISLQNERYTATYSIVFLNSEVVEFNNDKSGYYDITTDESISNLFEADTMIDTTDTPPSALDEKFAEFAAIKDEMYQTIDEEQSFSISEDAATSTGYATLTKYSGNDEEVIVNSHSDGYPAIIIASGAFEGNEAIKTIRLGNNYICWEDGAFKDLPNLELIVCPTIPKYFSLESIQNCPQVKIAAEEWTFTPQEFYERYFNV